MHADTFFENVDWEDAILRNIAHILHNLFTIGGFYVMVQKNNNMLLFHLFISTFTFGTIAYLLPSKYQLHYDFNGEATRGLQEKNIAILIGLAFAILFHSIATPCSGKLNFVAFWLCFIVPCVVLVQMLIGWGQKSRSLMTNPISRPSKIKLLTLVLWLVVCWGGKLFVSFGGGCQSKILILPLIGYQYALITILLSFFVSHIFRWPRGIKILDLGVVALQTAILSHVTFYSFSVGFLLVWENEELNIFFWEFTICNVLVVIYLILKEGVTMKKKL